MANMIRFTPSRDLARLQREFDQIFDALLPARNDGSESENAVWSPRVDFAESEDGYQVWLDLPGVAKEDVEINIHEGTLTVSGDRKAEHRDEKHNYIRMERAYGRFYRSFSLPKGVSADGIQAQYLEGVLKLSIPKAEESKPRRIEIK